MPIYRSPAGRRARDARRRFQDDARIAVREIEPRLCRLRGKGSIVPELSGTMEPLSEELLRVIDGEDDVGEVRAGNGEVVHAAADKGEAVPQRRAVVSALLAERDDVRPLLQFVRAAAG